MWSRLRHCLESEPNSHLVDSCLLLHSHGAPQSIQRLWSDTPRHNANPQDLCLPRFEWSAGGKRQHRHYGRLVGKSTSFWLTSPLIEVTDPRHAWGGKSWPGINHLLDNIHRWPLWSNQGSSPPRPPILRRSSINFWGSSLGHGFGAEGRTPSVRVRKRHKSSANAPQLELVSQRSCPFWLISLKWLSQQL